ncbi:MAG: arylsulfatase [Pirellulaceae bacterium]|nr:arylsulfatase [Pirellulaceae bacterium]MDP6556276.1 arylsulfatase [Pirellulaceae bacterium]
MPRLALTSFAALLIAAPLFAAESKSRPVGEKPNIIYFMVDDLGYGELGCYGQKKIKTPYIDAFASEGMRFTQVYAGSNVCAPCRSVLMTGRHTGHTPIRANGAGRHLSLEDDTVAERMKAAGYATGLFGKWGLGNENSEGAPWRQGFDEFLGQLEQVHAHFYYPYWIWHNDKKMMLPGNERNQRGSYVQDVMHAGALDFIRGNIDKPFFLYYACIIPHVELVVPEEDELPYRGKFPKRLIDDRRPGYIDGADGLVTFAGMVSRMDRQFGQIITLLKELGIDDNTLVIFTSDNGGQGGGDWAKMTDFFEGNAPLKGYKGMWYEGGIRVPFIARWPRKIKAGTETDHLTYFGDFMPSACEVAGVDAPANTDGISYLPTLLSRPLQQKQHDYLFFEYRSGTKMRYCIRQGDWKILQSRPAGSFELYNIRNDISEENNLADKHPDIVDRMKSLIEQSRTPEIEFAPIERTGIKDYVR